MITIEKKDVIKIEQELTAIFKYYKLKYKKIRKVKLSFCNGFNCFYNWGMQYINMDFNYVDYNYDSIETISRHGDCSEDKFAIIVLLHEIGHAIDYCYNKKNYIKDHEQAWRNEVLEMLKQDFEITNPLEIRADEFANTEIKKWNKKFAMVNSV